MQKHSFNGRLFTSIGRPVRVSISHTDDEILLTVVGDVGELLNQPLTKLTLESTGGQGVLRSRGTGQWVDHNQIRFFLDETADLVQRRQFVRVVTAQRVVLLADGDEDEDRDDYEDDYEDDLEDQDDSELADTMAVNISGGGMLLAMPRKLDLEPDNTVRFILYLRVEEEPVTGVAKVIRVNEDDQQLALAFEEIARRDRERVIKFIFDRQRAAMAITRGDSA